MSPATIHLLHRCAVCEVMYARGSFHFCSHDRLVELVVALRHRLEQLRLEQGLPDFDRPL